MQARIGIIGKNLRKNYYLCPTCPFIQFPDRWRFLDGYPSCPCYNMRWNDKNIWTNKNNIK